jgi:heme O synthase-like polyprenyltransferase
MTLLLFSLAQFHFTLLYVLASLSLGLYLLLFPALQLYRTKERRHAIVLFNKASYYPLALLMVILVKISGLI